MKAETSPFFTVVIPTYNRQKLLSETLDALSTQTFLDYEVVVIDDGGSDSTDRMIGDRRDPRIRYFRTENRERGAARNEGIRRSEGRYITFLDSDDLPYPDLLENAHASIVPGSPPFVHVAYEIKEADGKRSFSTEHLRSEDKEMLITGNPLSCIGAFVRRDVALAHPFNEDRDLSGSEDWELWLRIIAHHGIKVNPRISAAMVNHPERSVVKVIPEQLYKRKDLALHYSFSDPEVKKIYSGDHKKIEAFADSYVSLHLALGGYRGAAIKYIFRSIREYPGILFTRRMMVVMKRIFLGS